MSYLRAEMKTNGYFAVNDDEIRRMLRDERLQNVVRDIDKAENREAALKSMLKAPNFKEFTDKVLSKIAPEIPE
jgi:hypothetical protein